MSLSSTICTGVVATAIAMMFLTPEVSALTTEQWKSRTIYQVITDRFALAAGDSDTCNTGSCPYGNFCGGTFAGIESKLPYIQAMGFDAVWISPVVQNIDCGYHGYWAQNLSAIEHHFGGAVQLKSFMDAARAAGVAVMLDIVGNHMGPSSTNDFQALSPFNSLDHYHGTPDSHCDATKTNDQGQREACWLVNLCDLKQENPYVTQQLVLWMQNLQKAYNFDGIRIDTVPYVPKVFWHALKTQALPNTYAVGEVLIGGVDNNYDAGYQYSNDGGVNGPLLDGILNYPFFWALRNCFQKGGALSDLQQQWQSIASTFKDVGALGIFAENHDQDRWLLGNPDQNTYKNALASVMMLPGVPIAYYGTEQGMAGADPDNDKRQPLWSNGGYNEQSPLFLWTTKLVTARKVMLKSLTSNNFDEVDHMQVDSSGSVMSFQRGAALAVVTKQGTTMQVTLPTNFKPGSKVCDALQATNNGSSSNVATATCDPLYRTNCDKVKWPNQQECESAGCCWNEVNPNPSNLPWCFYASGPSPPSPPSPPPPPFAPYCVTVDGSSSVSISIQSGAPRVMLPASSSFVSTQ
eukprot:m.27287 g.27287  ORF g.27287 m.27287 type:complete len:577 (-) comp15720_c1_seq1:61-1791(-)